MFCFNTKSTHQYIQPRLFYTLFRIFTVIKIKLLLHFYYWFNSSDMNYASTLGGH